MNLRFIDWIWQVRGSLPLAPDQSSDDAFARLDPLFQQTGTSHERTGDTLTFRKRNQAAQDKMSIFESGVLQVENAVAGALLRYRLNSRALLFCFLAPLLFLGFAQLTIAVGNLQKPSAEEKKKDEKKKDIELPQNPIDKALGAPAPEKPKKDDEKGKGKDKDKDKDDDKKPSPTSAYVFATMFATLYVIGRILEDRLIKRLFRRKLLGT